jgi:hypothetical protein
MDYQETYKKRVKEEQEQSKVNKEKRAEKKKIKDLETARILESLKDHSSGLISWKRKSNSYNWDGYVENKKVFKINQGIFKYSLSLYKEVEVQDKKDKGIKTSFELKNIELIAEDIAKKIVNKVGGKET